MKLSRTVIKYLLMAFLAAVIYAVLPASTDFLETVYRGFVSLVGAVIILYLYDRSRRTGS